MTKLVSSMSVSLLSTMSRMMLSISFGVRCLPSSFRFIAPMLSGFEATSTLTTSPCFVLSSSSTSSNSPMWPGRTAFLLSPTSTIAMVFLPLRLRATRSIGCKSSSLASFSLRRTTLTSPVAISMSLTVSFI